MFNLNSICSQLKMLKICIDIESFNHHSSGVFCVTVFYFQFQWYYLNVKMVNTFTNNCISSVPSVGCGHCVHLGIRDVTAQCWLHSSPAHLCHLAANHPSCAPGGWPVLVCVNIFSIILRTFILVLSLHCWLWDTTTLASAGLLPLVESTNNKLDICVNAEPEILCHVLSRSELVRENREQMGGNQM